MLARVAPSPFGPARCLTARSAARQRQAGEVLDRAQHEAGVDVGHAGGIEQLVQQACEPRSRLGRLIGRDDPCKKQD